MHSNGHIFIFPKSTNHKANHIPEKQFANAVIFLVNQYPILAMN